MKPMSNSRFGSIRLVERRDAAALIDLIVAIELFPPEELEEVQEIIDAYLNGGSKGEFWLVDDDPELGLCGVAYCAPERMAPGTWNLLLIGVHSHRRHQGRGTRLIQRTEDLLRERGNRILIVETSSLDEFKDTRRFYAQTGYTEEARVRDFYKPGEDKIVFWKSLRHVPQS